MKTILWACWILALFGITAYGLWIDQQTAISQQHLQIAFYALFKAAAMTYDWIPEQTEWSQVVKGTLEKEFLTTTNISTSFCSKIHYRAFMTAHPFIKQQKAEDIL